MKRSSSADRAPRPEEILPFNNSLPARPTLTRTASLGREVRCGCQFYGTDSLLPEIEALKLIGRPKAKSTMNSPKSTRSPAAALNNLVSTTGTIKRKTIVTSARSFSYVGDHEYETVNPPPPTLKISGPYDRYEPELGMAPREGSNSSTESRERKERKFLRIPLDDEMQGLPNDGEGSEDEVMGVEEKEEGQFDRAAAAPSPGTTTGSRTDLELNTSQVDSSALEDLPLSREARRQQRLQQAEERGPGAAARSMQRIRSQAGKLRTKLRSIKRPNINMPNMPERPRFSMPERPKFNFPERPKFNFPERPKFNLPERPKFNFPDRPKFNMPQRPKFNMPERPKFNFPSFSMPRTSFRRPLRERQDASLAVPGEENVHLDTPAPSTPGKRNYFDFRTYPRIFDRKSRQQRELTISSPMRRQRPITPPAMNYDDDEDMEDMEDEEPARKPQLPPRRKNSRSSEGQRWVGKFTELEYVDSENYRPAPRVNGAPVPFDDEDEDEEMRALERELHASSDHEDRSESISGFRDKDFGYAVSLGPIRAPPPPVMDPDDEEISLPESEREVAHSSGSSSDRRRAGVLEEIDSDEFFLREKGLSQEDIDVGRYLSSEIREAFRPAPDANALLLENATLNEAELARSYRGTPERAIAPNNKTRPPRRVRAAKQRSSPAPAPEPPVEETSAPQQQVDTQQYFNTFPPNKPTRNRRRLLRQQERLKKEHAATMGRPVVPPQAPKRKKTTRSEFVLDNTSQYSEELNHPDWLRTIESQIESAEIALSRSEAADHEYIVPAAAPAAPKRGRRQSRQTPDEDADPGYASVVRREVVEIEIVGPPCTPPPRRVKPQRPPFPSIRRNRRNRPLSGSGQHFFTVPHRRGPPTRPLRNYSTLGPARPPRKQRRSSVDDIQEAGRDLQSGAVIQRMKERPLPPPPRPPRRERGPDSESNMADELEAEIKEIAQEAPIAACEEEQDLSSSRVTEKISDIQLTSADDFNYADDEVPVEENVIQHVIKLSSEIVHVQQEIMPTPHTEIQEIKSEILQSETKEEEIVPEVCVEEIKSEITSQEIIEPAVSEPKDEIAVEEIITEILPQEPKREIIEEPIIQEEIKTAEICSQVSETPAVKQEIISQAQEEILTQTSVTPVLEQVSEPPKEVISESVSTSTDIMVGTEVAVQSSFEDPYVPVEEVNVSTQTDPLPEDVLMSFEMEQDEVAPPPPSMAATPAPAPAPPPPPQQAPVPIQNLMQLSPATAALLEALSSGQLRLELLDVARLSVNELQAQRLMVSDIDGLSLNVNELQSRGGTLVLSSLDAPLGSLAEALMTAAQQLVPPPPPPAPEPVAAPAPSTSSAVEYTQHVSEPVTSKQRVSTIESIPTPILDSTPIVEANPVEEIVSSISTSESFSEPTPVPEPISIPSTSSETELTQKTSIPPPSSSQPSTSSYSQPSSSAHPSVPVFTTEQVVALQAAALSNAARDRESSPFPPPLPPRRPSLTMAIVEPRQQQMQEVEPSIAELGSRLARACCTATLGALRRVVTYSEAQVNSSADEMRERSGLQVALCIVLVLVAGIILVASLGGGAAAVHHHHWDFYMPQ